MPQYAFDSSSVRIEHVPGSFAEYVFSDESHWSVIMGMRVDYNSYYRKMLYTSRLHVRCSSVANGVVVEELIPNGLTLINNSHFLHAVFFSHAAEFRFGSLDAAAEKRII